ncbi:MAG: DUF1080 domain-containing protein [Planctomycetales bacterium]|nr:DUF1080 domain-containing protein [Planctomycetales bacterium]
MHCIISFCVLLLSLVACGSSASGQNAKPEQSEPLPWVDTSRAVPSDAVVIFDGKGPGLLVGPDGGKPPWPIRDGAIVCDPGQQATQQGLWTKLHFRDAQIHAEFSVPAESKSGESSGNSGVYLHGLFEQQILNSFKNASRPTSMIGALYGFQAPLVNASRPPGEWQAYDIIFKAPRRDEKGEAVEPGMVTTLLNGVVVQINTPFKKHKSVYTPLHFRTTPYAERIRASLLKTGCGPFQLQNHNSPVSFRNIWIRPLDDKSFLFETE